MVKGTNSEKDNMKENYINITTEMNKGQVKKIPIWKTQDQIEFRGTG